MDSKYCRCLGFGLDAKLSHSLTEMSHPMIVNIRRLMTQLINTESWWTAWCDWRSSNVWHATKFGIPYQQPRIYNDLALRSCEKHRDEGSLQVGIISSYLLYHFVQFGRPSPSLLDIPWSLEGQSLSESSLCLQKLRDQWNSRPGDRDHQSPLFAIYCWYITVAQACARVISIFGYDIF